MVPVDWSGSWSNRSRSPSGCSPTCCGAPGDRRGDRLIFVSPRCRRPLAQLPAGAARPRHGGVHLHHRSFIVLLQAYVFTYLSCIFLHQACTRNTELRHSPQYLRGNPMLALLETLANNGSGIGAGLAAGLAPSARVSHRPHRRRRRQRNRRQPSRRPDQGQRDPARRPGRRRRAVRRVIAC